MKSSVSLLLDEKGTAFLETLISIPILLLILVGVLALNSSYAAKLEAKSRGRRVAWLQADSGECPARGCSGGGCEAIEADLRVGGLGALSSVRAAGHSLSSFVGNLRDFIIGKATIGVGTASAVIPHLLISRKASQRGAMTLLCNTTPRPTTSGESILDHACSTDLNATEYAGEVCR
jgi:hypothetical protein